MTDAYLRHRQWYTDKSKTYNLLAADTTTELNNIVAVKTTNHQLFIQRIIFSPTTYSAKTLGFQDDAGTPVPIGLMSIPAAAVTTGGYTDQYILDYGPAGMPLTAGKNLDGVLSGAGPAGPIRIEAYERIVSGALNTGTAAASN